MSSPGHCIEHSIWRSKLRRLFFILLVMLVFSIFVRQVMPWLGVYQSPFVPMHQDVSVNYVHDEGLKNHLTQSANIKINNQQRSDLTTISFKFYIHDVHPCMDLFQADGGGASEISLKLSPLSKKLTVLVGSKGFEVGLPLEVGVWHFVKVQIWDQKYVNIYIDNDSPSRFLNTSFITQGNGLNLSNIVVGGASSACQFDGKIHRLLFQQSHYDVPRHQLVNKIFRLIQNILLLVTISLAISLLITTSPFSKSDKIECLSLIVLVGFFVAVVFHYVAAYYFGAQYPRDTFIFKVVGGHFGDFLVSLLTDQHLNPYHSSILKGEYFPFTYLLLYPLTLMNHNLALTVYSLLFVSGIWFYTRYYLYEQTVSLSNRLAFLKNCFILSFLTLPFLFSFERGNLENILFLLIAATIYFYQGNNKTGLIICLSMAGAIKIYPLVFILLLIRDKRWVDVVSVLCLTVVLTMVAMFSFPSNWYQTYIDIRSALATVFINCINKSSQPDHCIQYSVALWAPVKWLYFKKLMHYIPIKSYWNLYDYFSKISVCILSVFVLFIEKQHWRRVALLSGLIILLPILSNPYKLLYILLPLMYWINAPSSRDDAWYMTLFALLLIPKNYAWIRLPISQSEFSINEFLNIGLLGLLVLSIMAQAVWWDVKQKKVEG